MLTRRHAVAGLAAGALALGTRPARADEHDAAKDLVVRFLEAGLIGGDLEAAAAMLAPDYDPHRADAEPGPDAWVRRQEEAAAGLAGAFAEAAYSLDDAVAEGETVAARLTLRLVARDGREAGVLTLAHFRVADGAIAESWTLADTEAALALLSV